MSTNLRIILMVSLGLNFLLGLATFIYSRRAHILEENYKMQEFAWKLDRQSWKNGDPFIPHIDFDGTQW